MTSVPVSPLRENGFPPVGPQGQQPVFGTAYYQPSAGAAGRPDTSALFTGRKIRVAFLGALLFVALSYNGAYRITETIWSALASAGIPGQIFAEWGPTLKGVMVHAALFFLVMFYIVS